VAAAVRVIRAPVNNHFGNEVIRSSVANPYRRRSGSLRTGFTPATIAALKVGAIRPTRSGFGVR
jgi:hypothetical protein